MIKHGVDVRGLQPEMLLAIQESREIYRAFGVAFVITSVKDGQHMPGSLHFTGQAVDVRTRHLHTDSRALVAEAINRALGTQYDVVLESDHIHIEFDPK